MKRSLLLSLLLSLSAAFFILGNLPPSTAQTTPTDEVSIIQLTVPTLARGVNIRGVSDDGKRIVFDSINDYSGENVDSNLEIFVLDADTRKIIQLTNTADLKDPMDATKTTLRVTNNTPAISGDGTRIVFTSNVPFTDAKNDDGNQEIHLATLPRNATKRSDAVFTRITDTEKNTDTEFVKEIFTNYSPTINGDGSRIAFVSTRRTLKALENGTPAFSALDERRNANDPPLTPDGNGELFSYDLTAKRYAQVTVSRDVDAMVNFVVRGFNNNPFFSGDGRRLVFVSGFNYPGATANKNSDFNGELHLYNVGAAANTFTQITDTTTERNGPAVPAGNAINLLPAYVHPLNQTGSLFVFESSGDFASSNADKTREVFLADLSGATPTFRQITNQATVDVVRNDFNFLPSINASGTFVTFGSTLNLTPASTSSVTADNADGSRETFRYDIAGSTATAPRFRQLTFTPTSALTFDQRTATIPSYANIAGNVVTFSHESDLIAANLTQLPEAFQAVIIPVTMKNSQAVTLANAASFDATQVARGSIVAAFGTMLANGTTFAASAELPTQLAGVTVTVNGLAGRLVFVSPGQVNFVVPGPIATGDKVAFTINNNGIQSAGEAKIVDVSPGVFTTATQCGRVSADGLDFIIGAPPCTVGNEANADTLILYGTGWRNGTGLTVKIGETTLTPNFSGPQSVDSGLDQMNINLTKDLAGKMDQEITVQFGTVESNKHNVSFLATDEAIFISNAASFEFGTVARGSLAVAQGTKLADSTASAADYPLELNGVRVTVAGKPARLSFVSDAQVNFVVPNDVTPADLVEVVVNNRGVNSRGRVNVLPASPGLLTTTGNGEGQAIAQCGRVNADGSITLSDPPCGVGTEAAPNIIRLFGTGWRNADALIVTIDGKDLTTTFFGAQPGSGGQATPGVDQVDAQLMLDLAGKTDVDVIVTSVINASSGKIEKSSKTGIKISFQ